MAPVISLLTFGLVAFNGAFAHPGHSVAEEAAERRDFIKRSPRSVRSCSAELTRRGHVAAAMTRRQQMTAAARMKRSLPTVQRRDFAEYNISHASSKNVTMGDDEKLLFSDDSTCILQPEVTQGPYYVDGELMRSDVVEDQEGVPLYLDIQIIDTSSCEPVPAVFMDLWHCNATGVYSGVDASQPGETSDEAIEANLAATFLRGIQQTDVNGVAQFETIFPGHYTGRATHIHIMTHAANDTTIRTNGTLLGSNFTAHASHVGQLFFDQDLIAEVDTVAPYSTNDQGLTANSDDDILLSEAADMDPFVEYILLGDSVSDGIMAWISIGIDPSTDSDVSSAATHYKGYGVANNDTGMGGGGGGGGAAPSGTMGGTPPSGAMSGAPPSGTAA